jgi:hypothetical protein
MPSMQAISTGALLHLAGSVENNRDQQYYITQAPSVAVTSCCSVLLVTVLAPLACPPFPAPPQPRKHNKYGVRQSCLPDTKGGEVGTQSATHSDFRLKGTPTRYLSTSSRWVRHPAAPP